MSQPAGRIEVAAAAIVRQSESGIELFSARRSEPDFSEHGWEFPGGKIRPQETPEQALHREIAEELSLEVELLSRFAGDLPSGAWALTERIHLHLFVCKMVRPAEPVLSPAHREYAWLPLALAESVPWLPADRPLLRQLVVALPSTLRG